MAARWMLPFACIFWANGANTAPPASLADAASAAGRAWPLAEATLHIDKSAHTLTVLDGGVPIKTYRVGLGDPTGDKVQEGDRKTPTGRFRIISRNPNSAYHLFLGLSYPVAEDAARGLKAGWITEKQAQQIRWAERAQKQPLWRTRLGGAIGIHGGGSGADWTLGCIALENYEIEEIWAAIPNGTVVDIEE